MSEASLTPGGFCSTRGPVDTGVGSLRPVISLVTAMAVPIGSMTTFVTPMTDLVPQTGLPVKPIHVSVTLTESPITLPVHISGARGS